MDENIRPKWLTANLIGSTVEFLRDKDLPAFGEDDAVELLVTLGQILEVMGSLDFEVKSEGK